MREPKSLDALRSKPQREGPRSAARLLSVLRCLTEEEEISLSALSHRTGIPKSSLLALLRALVATGYVRQVESGYALGAEAFALASLIVAQRKLVRIARPVMQALADQTGETILLAELSADESYATYIERTEGTQAIRFIASIGERRELYASAAGRVLLAFQSPDFRKSYLARTRLVPLTSRKAVTRPELLAMIDRIRETRLATSNEDVSEGVAGFGAPIFQADGRIVAALTIGAPALRGQENAERLGRLVREAAAELSRILGYAGDDQVS